MKITKRVFADLAIWMLGFGILVGFVFPFMVILLGVPKETSLTPIFFIATVSAGILLGLANILLAKIIVGRRISATSQKMIVLARGLKESFDSTRKPNLDSTENIAMTACEDCYIPVDSEDEFGESAAAFNSLFDTTRLSLNTERAVRNFSQMLNNILEIDALAEQALRQFINNTSAQGGIFVVYEGGTAKIVDSYSVANPEKVLKSSLLQEALRTQKTIVIDLPPNLEIEHLVGQHPTAQAIVRPINYKSVCIGAVLLVTDTAFGEEDLHLIDMFSRVLSIALNNAISHQQIRTLAAMDSLTGSYNRSYGLQRLHEEYSRSVRTDAPLGVILFDLDHFKNINDTYGHIAGDRVLKRVAKTAEALLREGDIMVRYGGEEFIIIFPGAAIADLKRISERIRHAVEDQVVTYMEANIKVTISTGLASFPEIDVTKEIDLIRIADEAMYYAKAHGRNKVIVGATMDTVSKAN
jgi:two-component system cell cycle response regulator